jgi:hypothetical protein
MAALLTKGERREGRKTYHHFPHSISIMHTYVAFKVFVQFLNQILPKLFLLHERTHSSIRRKVTEDKSDGEVPVPENESPNSKASSPINTRIA